MPANRSAGTWSLPFVDPVPVGDVEVGGGVAASGVAVGAGVGVASAARTTPCQPG